ncbi:DEAD/DEAH box helicase [Actinocorallia libanotica]|uniref:DEAD/DEAH box helicase n=1 Tax=Actinocorallia libanotica TaxID=46162 RepID=UPI003CD07A98
MPARAAAPAGWPAWVPDPVRAALGFPELWEHQVRAASLAHGGDSVIIATGTASGKSLAYLLPALSAAAEDETTLYLAPTKALARDQERFVTSLEIPGVRASSYDGDSSPDSRDWIRRYANIVLTNPDMLHYGVLPGHSRWASFLRRLRYVVIDEAHGYRGVFGSHVAQILRRLRRVCARYGSSPVFVLASATVSDPAASAAVLTGLPVEAVVEDGSPRGAMTFAFWEPPLLEDEIRRPAPAETADLLADLVAEGAQTLAFVRSRRGVETVSLAARRDLAEAAPDLVERVAAYRGGYLPEERRALEAGLRDRSLLGLATTNALELGIDISGLDAVLICGWPGTRASLWQQAGRAGRGGQDALAVLIARDDPLDTYLVHHPSAVFGTPVEATVLDPANPYVLEPHLCSAAAELPLTDEDFTLFGATSPQAVENLTARGLLRRRPTGWYWTHRQRPSTDLRGSGPSVVQVVESATGRLLGTVDESSAHGTVHEGALYVHQGETFLVDLLDLDDGVALVTPAVADYTTSARSTTDIHVLDEEKSTSWGAHATLHFGTVEVRRRVVSYQMRRHTTGEIIGEKPLDLPERVLRTKSVWWTLSTAAMDSLAAATPEFDAPGAAHAAEHASIGLLPLFATCDRWDIGGVSTPLHPDTGRLTVFVYDGHPGGAGFAERAYTAARPWLQATRQAIAACECDHGCPSCIQSPKCGNGNDPLDKQDALSLLSVLLGP